MSAKVTGLIEIRDMKILQDTLKKMKIDFTANDKNVSISRRWNNIVFNHDKVTYDDVDKNIVTNISVEYAKNFKISELDQLGEVYQVEETNDFVKINVM
jgi:hypothetical protein